MWAIRNIRNIGNTCKVRKVDLPKKKTAREKNYIWGQKRLCFLKFKGNLFSSNSLLP